MIKYTISPRPWCGTIWYTLHKWMGSNVEKIDTYQTVEAAEKALKLHSVGMLTYDENGNKL